MGMGKPQQTMALLIGKYGQKLIDMRM